MGFIIAVKCVMAVAATTALLVGVRGIPSHHVCLHLIVQTAHHLTHQQVSACIPKLSPTNEPGEDLKIGPDQLCLGHSTWRFMSAAMQSNNPGRLMCQSSLTFTQPSPAPSAGASLSSRGSILNSPAPLQRTTLDSMGASLTPGKLPSLGGSRDCAQQSCTLSPEPSNCRRGI